VSFLTRIRRLLQADRTWEGIRHQPQIHLYAGHVPDRPEYQGKIGLSLTGADTRHLWHDMTRPFPIPDGRVDSFQSEDVFEHIDFAVLSSVIDEIYRILKPGGRFRLSLPDYGFDGYRERSEIDADGNIVFDPEGGGTREHPGHVWFPRIDSLQRLLETTRFHREGTIHYLHYTGMDGSFVTEPIDYRYGHIMRTPDFDERAMSPYRPLSLVADLIKSNTAAHPPGGPGG